MIKVNIVLDKKIWEKKLKKPEIYFKKKLNKLSKLSTFIKKSDSVKLPTSHGAFRFMCYEDTSTSKEHYDHHRQYLKTKKEKMGHMFTLE